MSGTKIITERTTSFKSFNFNKDPKFFCLVKIRVKHLKYEEGDNYLDISYNYSYSDNHPKVLDGQIPDTHPFYGKNGNVLEHKDGDIVRLNSMVKEMIKMLFLEDSKLEKHIGRSFPDDYKKGIMRSLGPNFWD